MNARDDAAGTPPLSSGLKLMSLLDLIGTSERPVTVSDLARSAGRSRAEVHRQLVTLVAAGWMVRRADGAYSLTLRPAHLGQAALRHGGMAERVEELLESLATSTQEAASVIVLDGDSARIVQRAEPGRALKVTMALGAELSLWDSASGRVLIASASAGVVRDMRARGVELPTDIELAEVRAAGFACSVDVPGDQILGVAVPVEDPSSDVIRALTISGPNDRIDVTAVLAELRATARAMTEVLSVSNTLGVKNAIG